VRGCLFTLLLGAVVLAVLVTVGLPAAAGGVVAAGVTAAGLQADDLRVDVTSDPPTELVGLRADRVRIRATDATFRGMAVDSLDIVLDAVDLGSRSAETVDGRLLGVVVADAPGGPLRLGSVRITGGGPVISAATTIGRADAERLVADAVAAATGVRPSSVRLGSPDRVAVVIGPTTLEGRLVVTPAGDLAVEVVVPSSGEVVPVIRAGSDLPLRITGVEVTGDGLTLTGDLVIGLLG